MNFRDSVAKHFHNLVQIPREVIFGEVDAKYTPINLSDDSAIMFAGYVGAKYKPDHGLLLLAINPGGGGDAYTHRIPEDEIFYPLLMEFKSCSSTNRVSAFERVNSSFIPIVQGWSLWKILKPTLDAAGKTLDEVAYMNVVPYRTRGDKMPPIAARRTSWEVVIEPTLEVLKPKAIITLGKKAGSVVDILYRGSEHLYCVPRTIGDSWVSDDAVAVHEKMRDEFA